MKHIIAIIIHWLLQSLSCLCNLSLSHASYMTLLTKRCSSFYDFFQSSNISAPYSLLILNLAFQGDRNSPHFPLIFFSFSSDRSREKEILPIPPRLPSSFKHLHTLLRLVLIWLCWFGWQR